MAQPKPANIESIMVRPGQARGLRPEAVTGSDVNPDAAQVANGAGPRTKADVPQPSIPALPVRQAKEPTTTLSVRISAEIAAAIDWLAKDAGLPKQEFVAWLLNAGLTGQFLDWRQHLDDNYPRWRASIQK